MFQKQYVSRTLTCPRVLREKVVYTDLRHTDRITTCHIVV